MGALLYTLDRLLYILAYNIDSDATWATNSVPAKLCREMVGAMAGVSAAGVSVAADVSAELNSPVQSIFLITLSV